MRRTSLCEAREFRSVPEAPEAQRHRKSSKGEAGLRRGQRVGILEHPFYSHDGENRTPVNDNEEGHGAFASTQYPRPHWVTEAPEAQRHRKSSKSEVSLRRDQGVSVLERPFCSPKLTPESA